jgi:hypothetical protein
MAIPILILIHTRTLSRSISPSNWKLTDDTRSSWSTLAGSACEWPCSCAWLSCEQSAPLRGWVGSGVGTRQLKHQPKDCNLKRAASLCERAATQAGKARWSSLIECPVNARLETGVVLSLFLSLFSSWESTARGRPARCAVPPSRRVHADSLVASRRHPHLHSCSCLWSWPCSCVWSCACACACPWSWSCLWLSCEQSAPLWGWVG